MSVVHFMLIHNHDNTANRRIIFDVLYMSNYYKSVPSFIYCSIIVLFFFNRFKIDGIAWFVANIFLLIHLIYFLIICPFVLKIATSDLNFLNLLSKIMYVQESFLLSDLKNLNLKNTATKTIPCCKFLYRLSGGAIL